jgi:hypothetical protein
MKCLSALFSDRRLADHFGGKLHLGYMQIREKLTELQVWKMKKIACLDYLSIDAFSFTACFFRLIVQKLEICVLNIPKPSQLLMVMKLICSKFCCSLRIKSNG